MAVCICPEKCTEKMGTLSTAGQKSATELLPVIMAALRSRCGHYIFALWFLSSMFFLFLT